MDHLAIFDGDDTLWITEPLYDAARAAARSVVTSAGFDGAGWEALQREIDVRNVEIMGLSVDRFPTSCVQAIEALAERHGHRVEETLRLSVWEAAAEVFRAPAPLAPHAERALDQLAPSYHLALLTKGDVTVQRKRIADSGLAALFEEIVIVDNKDVAAFRSLVERFRVAPHKAWSIGNSLRSDVLPAIEAGLNAVLVDAHVWEYEYFERHHVPEGVPLLDDLAKLVDVLPGV